MKKKCDIIIPVYNAPEWVSLCIEAINISDQSNVINKIIIIDDCSNSETKELLRELEKKNKKVFCIHNEQNLGFVKSCNKGLALSNSDYIMLLNSDCLLAYDTTCRLINILENYRDVGLISPLSNNAANLSVSIPDNANYLQVDKLLYQLSDVFYPACTITGNCLVISRSCYEVVGGLDEAFGMGYGEETDYQFRAAQAGFKSIIAGNAYVFHKSQVSFGNNDVLNQRKKRNRDLFFDRWGDEYYRLLKEYEKNDPALIAQQYLYRKHNEILRTEISPFSKEFIKMVAEVDCQKNVSEFENNVAWYKSCKKILKRVITLLKNNR